MKEKIALVLAVAAIGFGLYHVSGFLMESKPAAEVVKVVEQKISAPVSSKKIEVWRLNQDVAKGDVINRRMLSVEYMTPQQAADLGFNAGASLKWQRGAVFRSELFSGNYLYLDDLAQPSDDDYVEFVMNPDRIAFPVALQAEQVIGGTIYANANVDILALTASSAGLRKLPNVEPLFASVRVLQVKKNKIPPSSKNNKTTEVPQVKTTAVLELTRKQAVALVLAEKMSQLRLIRSNGNADVSELKVNVIDVISSLAGVSQIRGDEVTLQ